MPTHSDQTRDAHTIADDYRTIVLNRISWGAVLAGVVTALVSQLILNMLGIGIGLTTLDAFGADNPQAETASMTAAIWWTVSGVISAFLGGYIAGRLSGRPDGSTAGWHGFVAWALTTLLIVWLLTTSASALIGGAMNRLGALGEAAGQAASQLTGTQNPLAQVQDQLRDLNATDAGRTARDNILTMMRAVVAGNETEAQAAEQRAVDSLAQARNIPPDQARAQISEWRQTTQQAAQQTREAAETARRVASQAAIYAVIALLLGAIAAWFGGYSGRPSREHLDDDDYERRRRATSGRADYERDRDTGRTGTDRAPPVGRVDLDRDTGRTDTGRPIDRTP